MARVEVCLFGKFSLRTNNHPLTGFDARKLQQLFCYLLLRRDHPQPREVLASLFWDDNSTDQAKKHLRQTLWQLQSALARALDCVDSTLLSVNPEWVGLQSGVDLRLDVADFEEAFAPVRDIQGWDLGFEKARLLERAVQLYQGDLLEGWYDDWCLYERERLQNMLLTMLDKLMGHCEITHQYEAGIVHGTRILSFDRAREHTHRALMRLQYLSGNRTGALRQYERCCAALEQELGVKPAGSTRALYEEIRNDRLETPAVPQIDTSIPVESSPSDLFGRLEQIGSLLTEVQNATRQGLREIEFVMKKRR